MKRPGQFSVLKQSRMILGMLIISMLIFSQQMNFSEQLKATDTEVASSGEDGNEERPVTLLDVDHDVITAGVQFHVNHVFYEIMNIEQDEEEDSFSNIEMASIPDDYRKVLFSQVISPNAP